MSIYYDIKEHLIIKNTEEHAETADIFTNHLVRLGSSILDDNARVHKLQIITDGEKREFSGETLTEDFHNIVREVKGASSIEAILDYGYYEYGGFTFCDNSIKIVKSSDMFDISEHLNEHIKEEDTECLKGLFYSIYNNADCGDDAGVVVAYGEKNGKLYTGNIENKIIEILPDGVWHSPQTAVVYDEDNVKNIEEVALICEAMTKFSSNDELRIDGNSISFYLNNLELKNDKELNEFIDLCIRIMNVTNGECWADTHGFTDLNSDDGRIVYVKINEDGSHEISIQSTDF